MRTLGIHIDLLQLHSATLELIEKGDALAVMQEFQKKGDVRFLGFSTGSREVVKMAVEGGLFDTIQVPYNINNPHMEEVMALSRESNLGVIVNRPMDSGNLSPKTGQAYASLEFVLSNPNVSTVLTGTRNILNLEQNVLCQDNIV